MARVCVFIRSLTLGGAEKQACLLALALQEQHDVHLLALSTEGTDQRHVDFLATHRIRTVFLPGGALGKPWALRAHLARERVQALFCFLPSDSVLGALAGRAAGVERIFCGLRNARMQRRKELALRFVHNHVADCTISNSHAAVRHFCARGFDARKMRVIPNGIFVGPPPAARAPGGGVTLLTVARFVEEKDFRVALAALRRVREAGATDVRYLIAGSGPLAERIRGWTREFGLEDAVQLELDPRDPAPYFARADAYVSTSRFEGLSNSILEAMNAGLPVVATDVGDNARLVLDGSNGRIVAVGDEGALAAALLELVRERELRLRYGAESRRILARGYSFEAFRRAYLGLLAPADPDAD